MKKFIFWLDSLSIHQSAMIRNLASIYDDITVIAWDEIDPSRRKVGWYVPNFGKAKIILKPTWKTQFRILSMYPTESIHIFAGIRSHKMVYNALCASFKSACYIGIQSEAHQGIGLKGFLRLFRSRYDALRFRKRISFILGMGSIGVQWFEKSGYFREKIFPFGYFVETPLLETIHSKNCVFSDKVFDLIFVGQLIKRKGWDLLLHALYKVNNTNWRLHVVGDGDEKEKFLKLCARLEFTDSVYYYGRLPNLEVKNLIWKSDLLVLPSRWDGWGAVVNEALMCGTPAVCSDKCGAAVLMDGHERGEVFSSESISSLCSVLYRRISQGKKDATCNESIRNWSKCIGGRSAANYLIAVIKSAVTGCKKPIPPWLKEFKI